MIAVAVVVCLGAAGAATWAVDHSGAAPSAAGPAPIAASGPVTTTTSRPPTSDPLPAPQVTVPDLPGPGPVTEPLATLAVDVGPRSSDAPPSSAGSPGSAAPTSPSTSSSGSTTAGSTPAHTAATSPPPTPSTTTTAGSPSALSPAPTTAPAPEQPSVVVASQYAHILGWLSGGKVVSLTFDDGPSPYSGRVLDLLHRYGIKATFCQIGEQVGSYPAIEARIKAEGHTFCNHSWDHDEALPSRSVAVIDSEITRTQQAIVSLTGVTPRYYRAPGGDWGKGTKLKAELAKFHTIPLAWADDSLDWTKPGVAAIVKNVLSTVTPGAIILMHDGGGNRSQTLAALPKIIAGLKAKGYQFVALPQSPPQ